MCKPAKNFKNQVNKYKRVIGPIFFNLSAIQQDHLLNTINIRVRK
jgi:hypothetical protein